MRKFLNTLYVLNRDAYLSLEGENIVLLCNKAEIGRVPLHRGGNPPLNRYGLPPKVS